MDITYDILCHSWEIARTLESGEQKTLLQYGF